MILELSITNFRSIRDTFSFSLQAESGQSKAENLFEIVLVNDEKIRLLKSAVLYGPNASGKTNFIRCLYNLTAFIKNSGNIGIERRIPYYEPFIFDTATEQAPCKMSIDFVMPSGDKYIRYKYQIEFNGREVLLEELEYYPKGQRHNLFKRLAGASESENTTFIHKARLSKGLGYKEFDVFQNQLLLSRFGKETPHELLSGVYLYFDSIEVWNALDILRINDLRDKIADELLMPENNELRQRINKLLKVADTKINAISIKEPPDNGGTFLDKASQDPASRHFFRSRNRVSAEHTVYSDGIETGTRSLSLSQESAGTNVLFALGGIILKRLREGGTLFFDELDNSLHPKLSKFLVRLFNNPISNPQNTQLVVATHEVTLLDKEVFRKDQIWFAEKDKFGCTEIFSAKEFEGVRDDTPFDKWYMNGKFGGQPNIKELEFIFSND